MSCDALVQFDSVDIKEDMVLEMRLDTRTEHFGDHSDPSSLDVTTSKINKLGYDRVEYVVCDPTHRTLDVTNPQHTRQDHRY